MLIAHEASKLQDIKVECPTKFTIQSMLTEQRVGLMKEEGPGLIPGRCDEPQTLTALKTKPLLKIARLQSISLQSSDLSLHGTF